ncbi:hypothetical protein DN069_07725 [Streptacidiphilus pinicola]|uniref:DUF6602 domain-containing protein n=1 Tax=Streptacidiphilus pinicola TaxID=2219663 RepID=A0A2X0KAN0_9ACTN|nr:hypothetical protein DN069_07725 [Streptacidiphilus pinicola]
MREDYDRLHLQARTDPQRSGHGGEGTWEQFLSDWLPPHYEVATRKYIIPDDGDDVFETDLVVFRPGYPRALRKRVEVLAAGVAAAFSVKLTLDRDGIRDGIDRAARLRRGSRTTPRHIRGELLGQFPVGLLAHSHAWASPDPGPSNNVTRALVELDSALVQHPREALDFLCVADLGTWSTTRIAFMPSSVTAPTDESPGPALFGFPLTSMSQVTTGSAPALSVFLSLLFDRLALTDPELEPLADGLRAVHPARTGRADVRPWDVEAVYSEQVRQQLVAKLMQGPDWKGFY